MAIPHVVLFNQWVLVGDTLEYCRWFDSYINRVHAPECSLRKAKTFLNFDKDWDTGEVWVMAKYRDPCDCSCTVAIFVPDDNSLQGVKIGWKRYRCDSMKSVWESRPGVSGVCNHILNGDVVNFEWYQLDAKNRKIINSMDIDYNPETYTGLVPLSKGSPFTVINWKDKRYKHLVNRFSDMRRKTRKTLNNPVQNQ